MLPFSTDAELLFYAVTTAYCIGFLEMRNITISRLPSLVLLSIACLVFLFTEGTSQAATFSISGKARLLTASEIAGGVPNPQSNPTAVYKYFISTDEDIVSIDDVFIENLGIRNDVIYNHPMGQDTGPLSMDIINTFPSLTADSWITTPGNTQIIKSLDFEFPLADGQTASNGTATWFDEDLNGAVDGFQFAQLTVPYTSFFKVTGNITLSGGNGISAAPFTIYAGCPICPEPSTFFLFFLSLSHIVCWRV